MNVLEFDSDRKMMSVVARDVDSGRVFVFSKGADISILPKIKDKLSVTNASKDVLEFSRKGYRTLVYAMKEVTGEKITEENIETDLILVGVTGVEDLL